MTNRARVPMANSEQPSPAIHRQRGAMLITMAIFFVFIIGLVAVAVDVGHLVIVRNELRNAADAAAVAGANCLNRVSNASGDGCTAIVASTLNWTAAAARAASVAAMNGTDGKAIAAVTVATGYRNLSGNPAGLQPVTLSPIGANDLPAVQVTVRRAQGLNGGPVQTLVTSMFGGTAQALSATAVAVISAPGTVVAGTLIPQVINQCLYNLYWNATTNSPALATSKTLNGVPQVIGQPWEIRIGSSAKYPSCGSGQWTSFERNVSDTGSVQTLIRNGNPTSLSVGDSIWIEPGAKTTLYGDLSTKYPTPPGADVVMPVVDLPNGLGTTASTPIVGFAGFHIDDIQGDSGKYIQGHFITTTAVKGASGKGSFYGAWAPSRITQ